MSRSQENTVTNTAQGENQQYYNEAQNSYAGAQNDIGDYENQIGQYAASNPYAQGGQFQTQTSQQLSDTAGAQAAAAGQALQGQALRTGENTAGDVAATEEMQQQNERNLAGQEAQAAQTQAQGNTQVQQNVLGATGTAEGMQAGLAGSEAGSAQSALGTQQQAAQTPSWEDELGALTIGGANAAANVAKGFYCWIAAELYGGWYEPRTVLVRNWLNTEFRQHWYGKAVMAAYWAAGEHIANQISKHPSLRRVFLPLFDLALKQARKDGKR